MASERIAGSNVFELIQQGKAQQRYLEQIVHEQLHDLLKGGGGGGTSGGMTEDWKQSVDRQLAQLHSDLRAMLYFLIGAAVIFTGMVGGLYIRTDGKFEAIEAKAQARADKADERLSKIEASLAAISAKLEERSSKSPAS